MYTQLGLLYKLNKDKTTTACLSLEEWVESQESTDRRVRLVKFDDGTQVSTVFLGLDHNHTGGKSLLFETMVFSEHGDIDGEMFRYSTYQDAEYGHEKMVRLVTDAHPELWIVEEENQ